MSLIGKFLHAKGTSVDAIWLTIVRIVTMLIGLICVKIVSVYFSLEEYAVYAQATLVISTVCSFSILGLTDAVNFFYNTQARQEHSKEHYLATIFGIQFIAGLSAACLILLGSNFLIDYFNSPELKAAILWIAFQPLSQNLIAMLQVLFVSTGRARHIAFINFILSLAKLAAFSIATFWTGSIITILALTFVTELLQIAYFVIDLHFHDVRIKLQKFCQNLCWPILSYAIPMAAFVLINALMRDTDKWVIGYFASADDLAIYTNCSRVLPFDLITASFFTVLVPIITKYIAIDKVKVRQVFGDYLNFGMIITFIMVGIAILYSRDLLLCLYDAKYLPGLGVFIVYLLVDLVRFANMTLLYSASGRARALLKIAILCFVINLVGAVVLYKAIGLLGPAIATLATIIFSYICYFRGGTTILEYPTRKLLSLRLMAIVITEILAVGAVGYYLSTELFGRLAAVDRFLIMYPATILVLFAMNYKNILKLIKQINSVRV